MRTNMNWSTIAVILLAWCVVTGCGRPDSVASPDGDLSLTKDTALIHRIQPLGVNTSCLGSFERIIRDHRFTPTRVYSKYMAQMKECSPPASSLVIQMLGGQQWIGGYSFVTIKKNGLCLTNPVSYAPNGTDIGETFWQACVPQNGASSERFRQQWLLSFNNNNAMQIQTRTAVSLGFPNAQPQCLDRQTPTLIKRGPCSLNNWQVTRAN